AHRDLGFVLADLLILPYAVELVAADDRAHFRVAVDAPSDLDRPGLVAHGVDEFPVDRPLHQNPAAGGTDFALVDEHAEERAVDRRLEIGVGEKDIGRFAPELERDFFQRAGRAAHDRLAHLDA